MSRGSRSPCLSDTVPRSSGKKSRRESRNWTFRELICDTPLPSNISKDSWLHPFSPLSSCCPRSSDRPSRKHSRRAVPVDLMLSWSWRLWIPLMFGVRERYPPLTLPVWFSETFLQYTQNLWSFFFQVS